MKYRWICFLLALSLCLSTGLTIATNVDPVSLPLPDTWIHIKNIVEGHLGRPYQWGASGLKSFDCSGFVWRVMNDCGILIKRTTARKYYLALSKAEENHKWKFGSLVFFSNLKHVGIVASPNSFYHSESSIGTNLSKFDPYWRNKIYGFRSFPLFAEK